MRSRWFHAPTLHAPAHEEGKKVSWLELFYDLIFVAAIIQLGNALSDDVSLGGFARFAAHFVPLWIGWTGFTFFANRFNVDDFPHRALVLLQMFALGTMAIASPRAFAGEPAVFALANAAAQGVIALLYLRAWIQVPEARAYSRYWGRVFAAGAAAFALSALLPVPWAYILWAAGIGAVMFAPISETSQALQQQLPLDQEHLSERYGLLTIIVLGESFVKVLSYLTEKDGVAAGYLLQGFFNLALTCAVWWIYFDDVAGAHVKRERGSWVMWLYGHLPLAIGITAVGVAVKKAITFDMGEPAYAPYRWLLAGTLALTFLSVALVDSVTERRNAELSDRTRVGVRVASAVIVLLLGQVGGTMSAGLFQGLVAAICVAQVLFDMMMAPFEESEELHQAVLTRELTERRARGEDPGRHARRDVSEAVRKGAPSELRRDLYFFFMEGSWTRLLLSFGFLYLFLNVCFAGLYMMDPGSIGTTGDQQFAHAFFFSVQTLSTIGYGAMSPASDYGDLIVTIEAAVGMLFVALATGMMFAKASRPRASVLFSRVMVVSTLDGQPTLAFRAANARGNEVVDAAVNLALLKDELTPEGHHIRRIHDLKLRRARTPAFMLSWVVFHVIDKDSPLWGMDLEAEDCELSSVIVTLMGHDGTYGQTTFARHTYYVEDIRVGERFVDVIHQLPDGRLMIDLTRFHDTVPEADPPVLGAM